MEEFKTSDFYKAAFLVAKQKNLIRIDDIHEKRATFVFENDGTIKDLVHAYDFGGVQVMLDARKLFQSIKEVKRILYQ